MGAEVPAWWHDWQFFWKIGAMSLLKVTGLSVAGFPGSAATAAIGMTDQMQRRTTPPPPLARIAISASRDVYSYLGVRPAAMISEIPGRLTGSVVHHSLQHIIAWFAERRPGYSMAVLDLCRGRTERD